MTRMMVSVADMRKLGLGKAVKKHCSFRSLLEREYAELLLVQKLARAIVAWRYEPFSLKLADGVRYIPDFSVLFFDNVIELVEVKGPFVRDVGRVKFRVAVEQFPEFAWCWAQKTKDGWAFERTPRR